jgi:sugar phosphate isomerase/epimerase
MKTLVSVAAILIREKKHPFKTIELVAGSVIDGIWQGKDIEDAPGSEPVFVANWLDDRAARDRLVENLKEIAVEAKNAGIQLAIEAEPGPLYVIRDLDTVRELCAMLDEPARADQYASVGLNLDIAHWRLGGFDLAETLAYRGVCERIVHGHASDNGHGHFGDVVLGKIGRLEDLEMWLAVLGSSCHNRIGVVCPWVSVELEAAKEWSMVAESLARLQGCCNRRGEQGHGDRQ